MSATLPPFMVVMEPTNNLKITPSRFHEWRNHAEQGGILIWIREGLVRYVTNPVLSNCLDAFDNAITLIDADRLTELPEAVKFIRWEQTSDAIVDYRTSG